MAPKHPEHRHGQGCGQRPRPKGVALILPERRVALARCRRVSRKNATNNHQKSEHRATKYGGRPPIVAICSAIEPVVADVPALFVEFRDWMKGHRGTHGSTSAGYLSPVTNLSMALHVESIAPQPPLLAAQIDYSSPAPGCLCRERNPERTARVFWGGHHPAPSPPEAAAGQFVDYHFSGSVGGPWSITGPRNSRVAPPF